MRQSKPDTPKLLVMQKDPKIKVKKGNPNLYISLISEQTKLDFKSNSILIMIFKVCIRVYVSKDSSLKIIDKRP